jgi:hypothetical protein
VLKIKKKKQSPLIFPLLSYESRQWARVGFVLRQSMLYSVSAGITQPRLHSLACHRTISLIVSTETVLNTFIVCAMRSPSLFPRWMSLLPLGKEQKLQYSRNFMTPPLSSQRCPPGKSVASRVTSYKPSVICEHCSFHFHNSTIFSSLLEHSRSRPPQAYNCTLCVWRSSEPATAVHVSVRAETSNTIRWRSQGIIKSRLESSIRRANKCMQ